jgi:hypothetical protein
MNTSFSATSLVHRRVHLQRAGHGNAGDSRCGQGRLTGPETSVTCAPASRAARADGVAHLAARQVGDAAHRVDRFEGRTGGQQHALAGQQLGLEVATSRRRISSGFEHSPQPVSPQAWSPQPGPRMSTPSPRRVATLRTVAGFSHIWRFIAGATSKGQSRASTSVVSRSSARPLRQLGEKIGRGGRDQQQRRLPARDRCAPCCWPPAHPTGR